MITLPDGFDFQSLVSDFYVVGSIVVLVSFIFFAYRVVRKCLRG